MINKNKLFFLLFLVIITFVFIHIELILARDSAPESILVQILDEKNLPEENAECFADINSDQINVENKPIVRLNSVYDFADPSIYNIPGSDKGYYLLETDFQNYKGDYDIKVICYNQGFSGISYTIINNTNTNCELKDNGSFLVC